MSAQPLSTEDWLGDLSAEPVNPGGRPAKRRTGRMRKVHCTDCGCIVYASASALQRCGMPSCGCGEPMQLANLRDRLAIEPDELQHELEDAGFTAARSRGADMVTAEDAARVAWNDAMREIGRRDLVIPPGPRPTRAGTSRCQWQGGYCMVYVSGRYCREHDPSGGPA